MNDSERATAAGGGCDLCGGEVPAAGLVFRAEFRKPGYVWETKSVIIARSLCRGCFNWANSLSSLVSDPARAGHPLGLPVAAALSVVDDQHCNYCQAQLESSAIGLDLVPFAAATPGRRSATHLRQQRLCRQCFTWWRTVLEDSSAVRGTSHRGGEGPMGSWNGSVALDAALLHLQPRDAYVAGETIQSMGSRARILRKNEGHLWRSDGNEILFLAANHLGRARDVLLGMPEARRKYVVVVAAADAVWDMVEALRFGARDFLASPLSPQQVSGAFERMVSPPPTLGRDHATGLPILPKPRATAGLPCHSLRFGLPAREDAAAVALLLRRFLRGYDIVGLDLRRALTAHIFCPADVLANVVRRLKVVAGEGVEVTVTGTALPVARAAA